MKKFCSLLFIVLLFSAVAPSFAQNRPIVRNANADMRRAPVEEEGFKKENLFTGGNVTLSFGSGYTVLGASPMLGYKLNDYFDAGVVLNYVFTGARDYPISTTGGYVYADKVRQHVFGPGVFVRAYPVSFLFAQAQFEQNFTSERYTFGSSRPTRINYNAPSLLLGAGYAGGRVKGGSSFYYMSLMFDVLKEFGSPYTDLDRNGNVVVRPIIRAGFNIGLFQGQFRRNRTYDY